jgi:hypothetical protein
MTVNPETDAVSAGYDTGIIKTIYNFITPELESENDSLFISEISSTRTEVRLSSNTNPLFNTIGVDAATFISSSNYDLYNTFRQNVEINNYFDEFYLNFGNNIYVVGVNSLLELDSQNNTISLLVKLYEPLPTNIGLKTELSIVTKNAESIAYQIEFVQENLFQDSTIKLNGPNYNIPLKDETGPLTQYKNYDDILSTTLSGSLFQLINNISSSSPQLSVDYTNYEDFIFFSSAYQRLYNFKEKVTNISSSQAQLNLLYSNVTGPTVNTPAISSSKLLLESEIQTIIASFDGYENFLYYTSGTYAWPKSNTEAPYVLYPPTSVQSINWYATQSAIAELYDDNNQNNLDYVVPEYLRYNSSNTNYMLFVNLIGQFFDEMWLYTKAITEKLDANSNLYEGVSKDLVATVLESLGTKIYDSTYTLENIYSSLIGLSANGSLYPTTGSALITNYVTASVSNTEDIPTIDDFIKLSYKKIYHNLPYLLKKKGTNAGLKALINIFGIPDTILQINEFGGKNKVGNNDWDYWQNKFNYKWDCENLDDYFIDVPWQVNTLWNAEDNVPNTLQFRFKTPGLDSAITSPSQSLWNLNNIGNTAIVLEYTGSGYTTGSYSGSITSSLNEYATLKFIPNYSNDPTVSASIYLPFFNGGWWSVMVTRADDVWSLYAANKIYNGDDGFTIGYTGSSTTVGAFPGEWTSGTNSYFGSNGNLTIGSKTYTNFSGSYQEIRYYNTLIPSGTFYDFVMNPYSIEGVGINGAYDQLIFRGTLGSDLYTASISMHPKITGSKITQSFASNSIFNINNGSYSVNREWTFQDQIPAGVRNTVSKKIKNISTILPYSGSNEVNLPENTTLSPFIYIDQDSYNSSSYVADVDYVEVAFSPQNEINEDINAQIGYFNIGDYIGDPRLISSSAESYPELDALRNAYFQKYSSNYNLWDYIRIIQYYDNALFKMIKDYVPVRSSLTTGIVIKQHILERNKYPVPQVSTYTTTSFYGSGSTPNISWDTPFVFQNIEITGSPIQMYEITGSTGGTMPDLFGLTSSQYTGNGVVNITQSWTGSTPSLLGPVVFTDSTQAEFFNGELSGSVIEVENGELNPLNPYKEPSTILLSYTSSGSFSTTPSSGNFTWQYSSQGSGLNTFWFVSSICVNITDLNGLNIDNALSNLSIGDSIKFQITGSVYNSNTATYTPFANYFPTGIVSGLSQISPNVIRINFAQNPPSQTRLFPAGGGGISIDEDVLFGNVTSTYFYLNPFLNDGVNFSNSEFNPIMDNALLSRPNPKLFDVDFASNSVTAVNRTVIVSASRGTGSATPSTTPESNYTTARIINPRYNGSENTSPDFNVGYSSSVPVIESDHTYFAYFDWIGGTTPEIIPKAGFNVKYLIDDLGNISTPNLTGSYYDNLTRTFNETNRANITFLPSSTNGNISPLQGVKPVIKAGALAQAIIFSQTGSIATQALTTMSFGSTIGNYNYSAKAKINYVFYPSGSFNVLDLVAPATSGSTATTASFTGNFIRVVQSDPESQIIPQFNVQFDYLEALNNSSGQFLFKIESSTDGTTWSSYYETESIISSPSSANITVTPNFTSTAVANTYYRAVLYFDTPDPFEFPQIELYTGSLFITQTPPFNALVTSSFWLTGSTSPNVLTGSQFNSDIYGISYQNEVSGSGYDYPYQLFDVQRGDQIRFAASENQAYMITNVDPPSQNINNTLYLTLDRPVVSGTLLNSFLIKKYVPNPNIVLIDAEKTGNVGSGAGFLIPEYASQTLLDKFDSIVQDLTTKGII